MKAKRNLWILSAVGCLMAAAVIFFGRRERLVPDATPSSVFAISEAELNRLLPLAIAGDCKAAFAISRHHTFWTRQYDESVKWLRVAAKCDDVGVKSELILMLLGDDLRAGTNEEIDQLLREIRALDMETADEYDKLVATRRHQKSTQKLEQ